MDWIQGYELGNIPPDLAWIRRTIRKLIETGGGSGGGSVSSVFGRSGTVIAQSGDYNLDLISDGSIYSRVRKIDVTDLTDGNSSSLHYHASDRDRSNHTGTQLASTISDLQTAVQDIISTNPSLTPAQIIDLTDGGSSALHSHSFDRDRANHTGTQLASTISNFSSAVENTVLVGYSPAPATPVLATDTVEGAIEKLQGQISAMDSISSYAVYTQTGASSVWVFSNELSRPCSINLYDSSGNEFEAEVSFSADYGTITVRVSRPMIGKAILS